MDVKDFTIRFHFNCIITLKNRGRLKKFITEMLCEHSKSAAEINYIFCSDDELLEINKKHLNHDYYTDIITFDLSEPKSDFLISDIYISVDRIRDNASELGTSVNIELHRVIFHGLLHLLGFKDKSKKDVLLMRSMEDKWLDAYFN